MFKNIVLYVLSFKIGQPKGYPRKPKGFLILFFQPQGIEKRNIIGLGNNGVNYQVVIYISFHCWIFFLSQKKNH